MPADTMVMLELLEEAGAEAVTLDELGVAGVRDPERALLALELLGLEIQHVVVRDERGDRTFECVRLARPASRTPAEQPTEELAALSARPAGVESIAVGHVREPTLRGYAAVAVLLAVVAVLLRRR